MTQSTVPVEERATISGWKAIPKILTEPVETFKRLGPSPAILPPYLFLTLLGIVAMIIGLPAQMEAMNQQLSVMASNPDAGLGAEEMAIAALVGKVLLATVQLIGPWFSGLVLALVAIFFGQFQGGGVPFKAYFGMIGYARIPLAIATLLSTTYGAFVGKPLVLSPVILLSGDASPFLFALLGALNPFGLWYYALLAIGFAGLFGREPRKGWLFPAFLLVAGMLISMVGAGFAANAGV